MSDRIPATWLTDVLTPEGFQRRGQTWLRSSGAFIDVVNTQISKAGTEMTINAGVCVPEIYAACWGRPLPDPIDEANCTVRARAGELIDGRDLWWPLDDSGTAASIANVVRTSVLDFLNRMHSAEAMERFLEDSRVVRGRYPPPIIYLALLKHQRADVDGGCSLLRNLEEKTTGPWRERVHQVRTRLKCR